MPAEGGRGHGIGDQRRTAGNRALPAAALQQAEFPGPDERLGSAARVELAVDVVEVLLDRAHRDDELAGDPGIRPAGGDEPQHLHFALGERLDER
jgi:hypothetical protein